MDTDKSGNEKAPRDPALREGRTVRIAASSAAAMVVAVATLVSSMPADAQQPGPFRRAERPGGPGGNGLAPRHADQRADSIPARQAGYPSPMSPEERRQLRRDIDEHGRDLYRERRDPR